MEIRPLVEKYREELVERLSALVAINSVRSETLPDAPFGSGPRDALVAALQMLESDGFHTVNLDNYAGYAEMGEGSDVLGMIGHLDIVPADKADGWDTDPFEAVIKDGVIYGRGVSDDKGAVVACMVAMKVLRDIGFPLRKRIRLIMGTNEESGSLGLKYYVEKEGDVTYGFTPDGDFPGVYGEKGMIGAVYRSKNTCIQDIEGGMAGNVVCGRCRVKLPRNCYSGKRLREYFDQNNIDYLIEEEGDSSLITVFGVPAHASTPELGVNAISNLMVGLKEAGLQDPFVEFYCTHFGLTTDGSGLGCNCKDEYGALTENNGMIWMKDGVIEGTIDIRYPVTMTAKKVIRLMEGYLEDEGGSVEITRTSEPLFYSPNSPLVSSLVKAYRDVTGDTETEPMTIGGGTYAKSIGNTIAFGCAFPGRDYHIHNTNEFCEIDELMKQAEIYVQALLNLLEL